MLPLIALAGSNVASGALSGAEHAVSGVLSSLNPGAARDTRRRARRDLYLNGALSGDLTAARQYLYIASHVGASSEKKLYQDGMQTLQQKQPQLLAQAQQIGELNQGIIDAESGNDFESELERVRTQIGTDLANGVQRISAGAGASAADAIDPTKRHTSVPFSFDTTTVLIIGGIIAAVIFLRPKS